jgi:hypothetical protein
LGGRFARAVATPSQQLQFALAIWVTDLELHSESIELSFGKWISTDALDRVLRCKDQECLAQHPRFPIDRDLPFRHRFEQSALRSGGRSVDFIREKDIRKNRARPKLKIAGPLVKNIEARDIAGKKVWRALDPHKSTSDGRGQRLGQRCFA